MTRIVQPNSFAGKAVNAFEQTYMKLFDQSEIEVGRLESINAAMAVLEEQLLDPNRVRNMDPAQQIQLMQVLTNASAAATKSLMGFGTMFMNIRTIVGMLDGVQRVTVLSQDGVDQFPSDEGHSSRRRLERPESE